MLSPVLPAWPQVPAPRSSAKPTRPSTAKKRMKPQGPPPLAVVESVSFLTTLQDIAAALQQCVYLAEELVRGLEQQLQSRCDAAGFDDAGALVLGRCVVQAYCTVATQYDADRKHTAALHCLNRAQTWGDALLAPDLQLLAYHTLGMHFKRQGHVQDATAHWRIALQSTLAAPAHVELSADLLVQCAWQLCSALVQQSLYHEAAFLGVRGIVKCQDALLQARNADAVAVDRVLQPYVLLLYTIAIALTHMQRHEQALQYLKKAVLQAKRLAWDQPELYGQIRTAFDTAVEQQQQRRSAVSPASSPPVSRTPSRPTSASPSRAAYSPVRSPRDRLFYQSVTTPTTPLLNRPWSPFSPRTPITSPGPETPHNWAPSIATPTKLAYPIERHPYSDAATLIQCVFRLHICRRARRALQQTDAAKCIQRALHHHQWTQQRARAAVCIQAAARGHLARQYCLLRQAAAACIQSVVRMHKQHVAYRQQQHAATTIQSAVRYRHARVRRQPPVRDAQVRVRTTRLQQAQSLLRMEAALVIQAYVRRFLCQCQYRYRLSLQEYGCAWLSANGLLHLYSPKSDWQRLAALSPAAVEDYLRELGVTDAEDHYCFREALVSYYPPPRLTQAELQRHAAAATKIQAVYRGYSARFVYTPSPDVTSATQHAAACNIQRIVRGHQQRCQYQRHQHTLSPVVSFPASSSRRASEEFRPRTRDSSSRCSSSNVSDILPFEFVSMDT